MNPQLVSRRMADQSARLALVNRFLTQSTYARRQMEPGICDFALGNPHEMPLAGFVTALQRWSEPRHETWFAYPQSLPTATAAVADALRTRRGLSFQPEDIVMTNGGFAALAVALEAIVDPGDEVIFISPPWFFYEALIVAAGGHPVRVKMDPVTFDLDLAALAAALTPRTRALIVNSPNNPTGKIYPPQTLAALARLLTAAGERSGRAPYILSDEAYSRILYDGREFSSPSEYYPYTLVLYTYGKTLLTPGQRIGYIALAPAMPERAALRDALFVSQLIAGYAFPNALLQRALPDLEQLSIDIPHLQSKRDRMVTMLRELDYEVKVPEGTFYLMVQSPWPDDWAFVEALAQHNIFGLPGIVVEMPGYLRLSLTASDDMIDRARAGFEAARRLPVPEGPAGDSVHRIPLDPQ